MNDAQKDTSDQNADIKQNTTLSEPEKFDDGVKRDDQDTTSEVSSEEKLEDAPKNEGLDSSDEPAKDSKEDQPKENETPTTPETAALPPAPVAPQATTPAESELLAPPHDSPGVIVLQWLTYAFWGWTILPLIWLIFIVIATNFSGADSLDLIPYALAATVVLLPLSLVCDFFYRKKEQPKKVGAAMVVMIIHAVIFALCGIGVLISAVFTVVQLAIGTSGYSYGAVDTVSKAWIYTGLIGSVIYALAFMRTLNPPKVPIARYFPIIMAILTCVFLVLGVTGPVAAAQVTKNDRLITQTINYVQDGINNYATQHGELPESLRAIDSPSSKEAIEKNLIRYKAEETVAVPERQDGGISNDNGVSIQSLRVGKELRYQLCVTYAKADPAQSQARQDLDYSDYLDTTGHPAGEVCYKLKTDVADDYNNDN